MPWTDLCSLSELKEGDGKYIRIGDVHLAVFLHEGKPYAMENRCPHAGGSLSGGWIDHGHVLCPWHQWAFEIHSGELAGANGRVKVKTFELRVVAGPDGSSRVQVDVPDFPNGAGQNVISPVR